MNKADEVLRFVKEKERVSYQAICEQVLNGNVADLHDCVAYLKENGYISTRETDQRTLPTCYAHITDKGKAKSLADVEKKTETNRTRRGRIIETILTAVIGGVIVLLVEHLLF